jgi:hypothetical protein
MKTIITTIIALFVSQTIMAQSELPDYAASEAKVLKKVKLDMPLEGRKYKNGTGYSLNPKLLKEMPKKVALVSFYSFDPGMTKVQTWTTSSSTHKTTTTKTTKLNAAGSSGELALGFFIEGIDEMTSKFKSYGMDLLMPDQYLDTDEKKSFYNNYKVEHTKFNDWVKNMGSGGHNTMYGRPDGIRVLDVVNEPFANYTRKGGRFITKKGDVSDAQVWVMAKDGKMCRSLGDDLCKALEVDAVILVYFTIYAPKDNKVILQNVNMHMFGPNPTALPAGKEKKFNYFSGQFYCGTRLNTELDIWKKDKKDPETAKLNFEGFDTVIKAMTTRMGDYLKEGIEKGKK